MAATSSSGTKKRRRRGPSLTFKTPSEVRKARSVLNKTVNKSGQPEKVDNYSVGVSTSTTETRVKSASKKPTKTTAKVHETSELNEVPSKRKRTGSASNKDITKSSVSEKVDSDSAVVSATEPIVKDVNKRSTRTTSKINETAKPNEQSNKLKRARSVSNRNVSKSGGSGKVDSDSGEKRTENLLKGTDKSSTRHSAKVNATAKLNGQASKQKRAKRVIKSSEPELTSSDSVPASIFTTEKRAKGANKRLTKSSAKVTGNTDITKEPNEPKRSRKIVNSNVSKSSESERAGSDSAAIETLVKDVDKGSATNVDKRTKTAINNRKTNVNSSKVKSNNQAPSKGNTSRANEPEKQLPKGKTITREKDGKEIVHKVEKRGKRQLKQSSVTSETDTVSSPKKRTRSSDNTSTDELSAQSLQKKESQAKPKAITESEVRAKKQVIPDRIKDVNITKKAFEKWKPLRATTIEFTEETLNTIILTILGEIKGNDGEEVANVLKDLQNRILERLPNLKGPHTQGDHMKINSQNEGVEQQFLDGSRELHTLNQKILEEQRLLAEDLAKKAELTGKLDSCEQQMLDLKVHPLIEKSKNVVNLPDISLETDNSEQLCDIESVTENNLRESLLKLREKAGNVGLREWLTKLKRLVEELREDN